MGNLQINLVGAVIQNELGESLGEVDCIVVNEHGVHIIMNQWHDDDPKDEDEVEPDQPATVLQLVGES